MSYRMRELLSKLVNYVSTTLRTALRRNYLRRCIKSYLSSSKTLTVAEIKEAKAYWKRYTKHFTPLWHEFYKQKIGVFDARFVPEDIMFTEIESYFNDYRSQHGIDNKCNYEMYFPEVKMPKTIFKKMRGLYYDNCSNIISKEKAVELCEKQGNVIFKAATEVGLGGGVIFFDSKTAEPNELTKIFEKVQNSSCDFIAQEIIEQHPTLAALNKASVNCIRVMTLLTKNGPEYLCSYLRMGQSSEIHIDLKGGCTCSINPDGTLCDVGVLNDTFDQVDQHACGIKFKGFTVPYFDRIKTTALELCKKIGDFRLCSFDFSVSPEGEPIFIEVNLQYGGINYHQAAGHGVLFGEKTEEILNEIYSKN